MTDDRPLVGEHPALDLINTRAQTLAGRVDFLATSNDLQRWLKLQPDVRLHALAQQSVELTREEIHLLHEVRELAAVAIDHCRHGSTPPAATLDGLNRAWRTAPMIQELSWQNGTVIVTTRYDGSLAGRLISTLAGLTAELIADPRVRDIRQCEGPGCVMLFLPHHARRRWCSPSRCGNRARVSRYYHRHKA